MESDKKQILNRLATIEGHLRAIQKMIEQDRCCRDILSQTYAVERALKAFEVALVDHHLVSRLPTDRAAERSSEMLHDLFEFAPLNETSTASGAWRTNVNGPTAQRGDCWPSATARAVVHGAPTSARRGSAWRRSRSCGTVARGAY